MSNKLAKRTEEQLVSLKVEVREEHEAAQHDFETAVERCINCGEMLMQAKKLVGHGNWISWLDGTAVSERQAQRYMQIARNPSRVSDLESQRAALAEIAQPKDCPPEIVDVELEEIEEVDAEVVDDEPAPRRRSATRADVAEGPAHYSVDLAAPDAEENLRTQAVRWFERGLAVRDLLNSRKPIEAKSPEDLKAIKKRAALMESTARRLKEQCENQE